MKAKGAYLLCEKQFDKAMGYAKDGDNTMLVWVGKQLAGQRENPVGTAELPEKTTQFVDAIHKHCETDEESV